MMEPYKGNPGAPRDDFIGPEEGLALDEMMLIEDYEHTSCDILGNSTKQGDRRVDLHPNSRQHRNRIAQRKFRERQKDKILQMEETIAQQNAKISQLQAENDLLTNRCQSNAVPTLEKYWNVEANDVLFSSTERQEFAPNNTFMESNSKSEVDISQHRLKYWTDFAEELRCLLEACQSPAQMTKDETMLRLDKRVKEGIHFFMTDIWMHHWHGSAGEKDASALTNRKEKWQAVVQSMELQQSQISEIIMLKNSFLEQVARQATEQACLLQKLQRYNPAVMWSLNATAADLIDLDELVLGIKKSANRQRKWLVDSLAHVLQSVLRPTQTARCIVDSCPGYPDIKQILEIVMELPGNNQSLRIHSKIKNG